MTTYVYESIPEKPGAKVRQFEIRQSMKEPALSRHPETGEPIRRIVSGGFGFLKSGKGATAAAPARHHCGHGGCCS